MSDTPITDAALCISHHPDDLLGWPEGRKAEFGGTHIVPVTVCRDLERQLSETPWSANSETKEEWLERQREKYAYLERQLDEVTKQRDKLETIAGELIAMIRVNVVRDTFREATIEQVDDHIKPWINRLATLKGDKPCPT